VIPHQATAGRVGRPTVSVLLPVRDGQAHLREALDSVLSQTLPDLEVIAVDDGSTDDTPLILARAAEGEPRLRVITTPPRGIVSALETARVQAQGRFLARMDADDISLPDRFRAQVDLMESSPEVALCGTRVEYFPEDQVREGARRYEAWINRTTTPEEIDTELFVECPLPHPTFFMRADAVEAVGGYRDVGWPEDYDLLLRLHAAGGRLARVPRVLLRWREGERRLSRIHANYTPEAFRACKVHFLRRGLLRENRPVLIIGAGPVGKSLSRALQAAGTPLAGFVELDPRKIGQEIHGAPVYAMDAIPGPGSAVALGAVGQPGARAEIRGTLAAAGWVEGAHFIMVA